MVDCLSPGKDWIDVLSALLTPTIAAFAFFIAFQQWRTNRNRLKHELFDRRYEVFKKITEFIGSILASGEVHNQKTTQFLVDTKSVEFLFDKNIAHYIKEVYRKANELDTLEAMLKESTGEERKKKCGEAT